MEHRLRRKQLNSDTYAGNKTYLKAIQKKEQSFFLQKKRKKKMTNIKKPKKSKKNTRKKGKEGPERYSPRRGLKMILFSKEMLQEILKQMRPIKSDFEQPRKEKEEQKKKEKNEEI